MDERFEIEYTMTPEEREFRRQERIAKRLERQHQRRQQRMQSLIGMAGVCLVLAVIVGLGILAVRSFSEESEPPEKVLTAQQPEIPQDVPPPVIEDEPEESFSISLTESAVTIGEELSSQYAIVIDLTGEEILAQKEAFAVMHPASMTKILTVLVAAEALEEKGSLDDTVTIDLEITDYCFVNDCSVAGFLRDETVTVRELFYGTILPSGADAALALARYTAGSHEEFVKWMNAKVEELGLADTAHFTNCVGLYNERNVCTDRKSVV